jgi:hypothetical protein
MLKLNGTHHILAYAGYINIVGENIDTVKINRETLLNSSKEFGLEVDLENTEYMLMSRSQNMDKSRA